MHSVAYLCNRVNKNFTRKSSITVFMHKAPLYLFTDTSATNTQLPTPLVHNLKALLCTSAIYITTQFMPLQNKHAV